MSGKYSTSIAGLALIIKRRKQFQLKLPGNPRIFRPEYDVSIFLEGDIVIFEAAQLSGEYFFIGKIRKIGEKATGERWYDVDCIPRPEKHDPARHINWLPKARINRRAILCEIKTGTT